MENSTGQMYMKKWGKKNRWKENWMYKPMPCVDLI